MTTADETVSEAGRFPETAHIEVRRIAHLIVEHVCGPNADLNDLTLAENAAEAILATAGVAILRDLARRCYNGAVDPYQEFYDEGMSPLLDRLADAIERVSRPQETTPAP